MTDDGIEVVDVDSIYSIFVNSISRPRILYSSIYAWISVTGGRFMAPFLRTLGLSDKEIGIALALQLGIMNFLGPWCGKMAEALERENPGRGRAQILTTGIIYATMEYLMNALEFENKFCYIALCGLYTVGAAMVFSALDGMTNEFLENSENPEEDLARERLYGAVWWVFTNLYMSMALDWYGFHVTYPLAAFSAVLVLLSVGIYSYSQPNEKRNQDVESKVIRDTEDLKRKKVGTKASLDGDSDDDDDRSHSDTCTATTATTRLDSVSEDISSGSEHESDISLLTERNHNGHDESSMDTSARSSAVTDRSSDRSYYTAETSVMESSLRSFGSERSASSIFLEGRKPLSTRRIVEAKTQTDNDKVEHDYDEEENKFTDEDDDLTLGEEYLLVFLTMCSSCYGCAFLFLYLSLSAGQSMVDNLIFLYFETMGASYLMMGYTIVITIGLELSISYISPKLLTYYSGNTWLVIAGLAYVVRVVGYTMIPPNHMCMIWVLELLHGLTYTGTLTAAADFTAGVFPDDEGFRATAQHLVSAFRGKAMTAAVFWGAWVQQEVGPQFMYRRAGMFVLLAIVSFFLALCMDYLFSSYPASSDTGMPDKETKSNVSSSSSTKSGDEESTGEESEESGPTRKRPKPKQQLPGDDFEDPMTISFPSQEIKAL